MRRAKPTGFFLLAAALLGTGGASAQPQFPFLLDLKPNTISSVRVRYTPGSLDRASHIQTRFSIVASDFAKWGKQKVPLLIYLLSREEWEGLGGGLPYGVPARLPSGEVMLSAWGDPGTVALWRRLGVPLPELEGFPIRGTPEEVASMVLVDVFGQVEACRALLGRAGYRAAEPWIVDLMAHTLSLASSLRSEPGQMDPIGSLYDHLLERRARQSAPTDALGREGDLVVWLWEQAEVHRAARRLIERRGHQAAPALLKLARKKAGVLGSVDLGKRFPEIQDWLAARASADG